MSSFNPSGSGTGQFSTLAEIVDDMLRENGESSPAVLRALEEKKFINYANRVVADINRHPTFLDLLDNTYDDQTGSITAGSNELTINSGSVTFGNYTPVKLAGAGYSGSNLYSFVVKPKSSGGSLVSGTYLIADEADTTVSGAVISHPYKVRLKRYQAIGDSRTIDDEVLVEGLKAYYSVDDVDTNNTGLIQLRNSIYLNTLNNWLGSLINIQGNLEVEINEYT